MRFFLRRSFSGGGAALPSSSSPAVVVSCSQLQQRRSIATAAFLQKLTAASDAYSATKKKEQVHDFAKVFADESLDDAATTLSSATVAQVMAAVAAVKAPVQQTLVFTQLCDWALLEENIPKMEMGHLGRLFHCCLTLHSPQLADLLMVYVWRVVEAAPSLDGQTTALFINAYGRAGFHHAALFAALTSRAREVFASDKKLTIAHVANVAHALSRVKILDEQLMIILRDMSIAMKTQVTPLVAATILDAYVTLECIDDDMFQLYENMLEDQLQECSPQLITSILGTLCKAGRNSEDSPLFSACTARAIRTIDSYDPPSVGATFSALYKANQCNEDLYGALAERACRTHDDFSIHEMRQTLTALSHSGLFDAELYPLFATRLVNLIRQGSNPDLDDIAHIIASFASVHERCDELINATAPFVRASVNAMPISELLTFAWAYNTLNSRNDAAKDVASAATQRMSEIETYESELATSKRTDHEIYLRRLKFIKDRYGSGRFTKTPAS